jgi:uncharacterized iron-regulated protein
MPGLLLSSLMLLSGCMTATSNNTTLLYREHPLVGQLWDVQQQGFIDQAVLTERMLTSEYLLLGEKHDNPVHHQHQSWVINAVAKTGRQASVAFKMIDQEQGLHLAATGCLAKSHQAIPLQFTG